MSVWKQQISIYTSESSRFGTRPLHAVIIATALEQGLYSAITLRAIEGFGPQIALPATNRMAVESDLPIEIRILDEPDAIETFLSDQADMLANCIIVRLDIELLGTPVSKS